MAGIDWRAVFVGREEEREWLWEAFKGLKPGEPKMRVFVAETGWGKTRLIQDFYQRLAAEVQPASSQYWPADMVSTDDLKRSRREVINPPKDRLGKQAEDPAFLWVGLQGVGDKQRSEAGLLATELRPHFRPYLVRRLMELSEFERKEAGKEFGIDLADGGLDAAAAIAEATLGLVPGIKEVLAAGKILNAFRKLRADQKRREDRSESLRREASMSPFGEGIKLEQEASEEALDMLSWFWSQGIPVVLVFDDAQWLHPESVAFARRVWARAIAARGRLLVVAGHWEGEWRIGNDFHDWATTVGEDRKLEGEASMDGVVRLAFPNLVEEEARKLVAHAEGHPLYVQQLILLLEKHGKTWLEPGEERLTETGWRQVRGIGNLGELCERRFRELPTEAARVLGWGSVQGMTFLHRLTRRLCEHPSLGSLVEEPHDELVAKSAESAVTAYRASVDGSRFDQLDFRELAAKFLRDEGNGDSVKEALEEALVEMILAGEHRTLPRAERMDICRLASRQLARGGRAWSGALLDLGLQEAEERNWTSAVRALQELAEEGGDLTGADPGEAIAGARLLLGHGGAHLAGRLVAGVTSESAGVRERLAPRMVKGDAARVLGDLAGALREYQLCLGGFRQLALDLGTPESRRDVSVSLNNVAGILRGQGDLPGALRLFEESLSLRRQLALDLGTPESRRDVSVSLDNVAGILRRQGDLPGALRLYEESLSLARQLALDLGTPESRRDVSVSLDNVAGILRVQGDLPGALSLYEESLSLARQLALDLGTPESRRDVSVSLDNVARILRGQGDLPGALSLYEQSLTGLRQLALDLGTPESRRDVSVSLNNVAGILRGQGDLPGALSLYEESLSLRRQLALDLGTPESRRDVSVSLNNVAGILRGQGDLPGALSLYEESLSLARQLALDLGTPESRRDLVVSCAVTGMAFAGDGQSERACQLLLEGREIIRALAEDFPVIVQFAQDLVNIERDIAQVGCE